MDQQDRDKLVTDVKQLQKLTRALDKSSLRIGKSNDTISWRRTFNAELQKAMDCMNGLQSVSGRIRNNSMDAQDDKLIQQSTPIINKFKALKQKIDAKLTQHEPINDQMSYNNNDNAYGNDNEYVPPTHDQQTQ